MLCNDLYFDKKLRRLGYALRRTRVVIGTHMQDPDDFQIFRRFYCVGVKYGRGRGVYSCLNAMFNKTQDDKYQFAMKALDFGAKETRYPGSHNIIFDRTKYEEFLSA